MEAKVSSLEKAIESLLKEKEKGILLVMKTVYWLCKEGNLPLVLQLCWPFLNLWILHTFKNYKSLWWKCNIDIWYYCKWNAGGHSTNNNTGNKQDSPCTGILVDKSTDINLTKMLVIYAQMIKVDSLKPVTRFLTNVHVVVDGKVAKITKSIIKALSEQNVSVQKLTGLGSDGASVMTGK